MDPKNLDAYLAGLGIDADEEATLPSRPAPEPSGPSEPLHSSAPPPALTPESVLEQFLQGFVQRVAPQLSVEVRRTEETLEAEISGPDAQELAGRNGEVMAALDTLAYTALAKHFGRSELRVQVDVAGYRKQQAASLESLAQRLAREVAASGEPHELRPMNPAERRVIHMALKDHPDVLTESVGEGTGRRLVVRPRPA
ncbi:protein jag [Deinococcus lacus]|uniref:Protein jag n=1 Tax=Deinococcus lacus TaxID=392561 RepID=A0ABW1YCE1_9DEIO